MKLRAAMIATAMFALSGAFGPVHAQIADPGIADESLSTPSPESAEALSSAIDAAGDAVKDSAATAARRLKGGIASWYGPGLAGRRTASGERFDPDELTAAHRTLPFGSLVKVTYHDKSVVVRINDRGPFSDGRVIDLSKAAAEEIGIIRPGSGEVKLALLNG